MSAAVAAPSGPQGSPGGTSAATPAGRVLGFAMPATRRGQKLAFSYDEDELSLAWDAVQAARLPPGSAVAVHDLVAPAWFLQGLGLAADPAAAVHLRLIPTMAGPSVCVHEAGAAPDVEAQARAAHAAAPARPEVEWQRHRVARDAPDTEADYPLGAYVVAARHDQVTAARMRLGAGTVASWTTIGAGAAPTEFARLQDAVGAYHSVLVAFPDGSRTVGLWTGDSPPALGMKARPTLRRLFKTQGTWRHGVKFAPSA